MSNRIRKEHFPFGRDAIINKASKSHVSVAEVRGFAARVHVSHEKISVIVSNFD